MKQKQIINITTPFIKLDQLLKFSGVAQTGGHAKIMIAEGEVCVNGVKCDVRGKKIYPGSVVSTEDIELTIADEIEV